MKMNRSLVFVVACLLYCNAFASLSSERNKYKTMYAPRDNKDTVNFVARDSSSAYTQNGTCGEVKTSDFTVTGLKLSREYYWQRKLETGSIIDHYHCLFRIAEVTYEVKCKNGKIIWGNEAPGFESEDNGIIPTLKGTIAWKDDAPWETNTFKPRVTVKNTGSIALSNYHAQLWFRVPQGKNLSPLDIWYAPESSPSVKSVINA
ncbi:MAG: hypothetical protein LBH25_10505, partial [Fibromonadaceae bacterium]|nr:hypothetical protein [Fibromonadaceae bacterium]